MSSNICEEFIICDICFETFNESDRRPRVLSCGHSFCCFCLTHFQANDPSCPNCKAVIQQSQVDLIPVNFFLESLISKLNKRTWKIESKGYCTLHDHLKEFRCMDCNLWVCGTCIALHHKNCDTILVQDYQTFKRQIFQQVTEELETREVIKESVNESLEVLQQEKMNLIEIIRLKQDELQDCEKRIKEVEIQVSNEKKMCTKLKNIQIIVDDPSRDDDFVGAKNELNRLFGQIRYQVTQLSQQFSQLPMTLESLTLMCQAEPLYAKLDDDSALYGEVMVKNGKIWIYSFKTEEPQAKLISFKGLLNKFNGSLQLPNRAFLQLSPKGGAEECVEVEIKTDRHSPRGQNFVYLCTALKQCKYKGLQLISPGGYSCYQLAQGGPPPVVEGIDFGDDRNTGKKGLVFGMDASDSWFGISLEDDDGSNYHMIGEVVSDLQTLVNFCRNKVNLVITDSGLVV